VNTNNYSKLIATVYPEVYPSDMPPLLARLEHSHIYIFVLTETKFSIRYIPVWDRYSPLRTRVEAHAITLSP